ncbi:MAG: c-type cytochrome [Magnetococcales bacterium]|nr:c-type cytochrome [Magnetococcales bacterium]
MNCFRVVLPVVFFLLFSLVPLAHAIETRGASELYQLHCAQCHHPDRVGAMGPALMAESLARFSKKEAAEVIAKGRPATQMPPFEQHLSPEEIQSLVTLIYTPLSTPPNWSEGAIKESYIVHHPLDSLSKKPLHAADIMNLFMVVELGDHHITVLDGDRLEPLHRFPSRFAVHGGIKYSPDGRFAYMASRDGWISQFDLYTLQMTSEIRVGINTRNMAVSGDGRFVMVANALPRNLVVLDAKDLSLVKIIQTVNKKGESALPSAVYAAPPRHTFVVGFKDLAEIWEIPYNDQAKPIYTATVHDFQPASGEDLPVAKGPFPIRHIELDTILDDFFFDQAYHHLIGASRSGLSGRVVNLNVGRKIAEIDIAGMPHLASGITWPYKDTVVMASPNLKEGEVTIVDLKTWKTIKRIKTMGPGFFMRSHENTPYAWVDVFFGPDKDAVHVIDKATLEIVKTLRPAPGKTSAHVEFTKDGRYALLSIWEMDGAVVVYDGKTLEEVKRIPMKKPSGKYNVSNKINRSAGTSH